jgi:membrane protein YqaA with SNARE-associated domain
MPPNVEAIGWRERVLALLTRYRWLAAVLAFLPMIVISVAVLIFGQRIEDLKGLGLIGAFTANLLGSGTFVLPVPGVIVTLFLATVYNPLFVGLASAAGSTVGELSGYLAGMGAGPAVDRIGFMRRVESWMHKSGSFVIFIFAFVPNPLFDFIGFAAGSMGYPLQRFLIVCALGKTLKFLVIAYAGYYGLQSVTRLFSGS